MAGARARDTTRVLASLSLDASFARRAEPLLKFLTPVYYLTDARASFWVYIYLLLLILWLLVVWAFFGGVIPYHPEMTTLTSAVRAVRRVFAADGVLGWSAVVLATVAAFWLRRGRRILQSRLAILIVALVALGAHAARQQRARGRRPSSCIKTPRERA